MQEVQGSKDLRDIDRRFVINVCPLGEYPAKGGEKKMDELCKHERSLKMEKKGGKEKWVEAWTVLNCSK